MENKNKLLLFGVVAVMAIIIGGTVLVGVAARNRAQNNENDGQGQMRENDLVVRGQLPGDSIVVESVNLKNRGFVVVQEEDEFGTPGMVIGVSDILVGNTTELKISVGKPLFGGERLILSLHADTDNNGEFMLDEDQPVKDEDGDSIMTTVNVIGGEAPESTPSDE